MWRLPLRPEIRDCRLWTGDERRYPTFTPYLLHSKSTLVATALMIAVRLRGRGPNADYMAALLMRDMRAAPPQDNLLLGEIKRSGHTPAWLLQHSSGLWAYMNLRKRLRTAIYRERRGATAAAPALEALERELILPLQPLPGSIASAVLNYRWHAWRAPYSAGEV